MTNSTLPLSLPQRSGTKNSQAFLPGATLRETNLKSQTNLEPSGRKIALDERHARERFAGGQFNLL